MVDPIVVRFRVVLTKGPWPACLTEDIIEESFVKGKVNGFMILPTSRFLFWRYLMVFLCVPHHPATHDFVHQVKIKFVEQDGA